MRNGNYIIEVVGFNVRMEKNKFLLLKNSGFDKKNSNISSK